MSIAAPSTNALKQSSWYRIRVTRSARSAGAALESWWTSTHIPSFDLPNVQAEGRQQRRTHLSKIDHARLRGRLSMEHRGVEFHSIASSDWTAAYVRR